MVNTNMVKAKIAEKGYNQASVAAKMGISYQSFNYKVNNIREFKVSEIDTLCKILDIEKNDAPLFFLS